MFHYIKGTGYGSTEIVNYENKPNILIKNGIPGPGKMLINYSIQ